MKALAHRLEAVVKIVLTAFVVLTLGGLLLGYRPVVLTTNSMSPAAPAGSLLFVSTVDPDDVVVGDILVMKRPSGGLLTHRVAELQLGDNVPTAITKGDANTTRDAQPYVLNGDQRVSRLVIPVVGNALTVFIDHPQRILLILFLLAVATAAFSAFLEVEPAAEADISESTSSTCSKVLN